MSSIGSSDAQLPPHEHREDDDADGERDERLGCCVQPYSGASMRPYTSGDDADDRQHRADGIELALLGILAIGARGTSRRRGRQATIGTLTRNTDPYQKWPSSQPLATGPIAPAAPVTPAQIAMAFVRSSGGNTLTRIDSVDGMMNAAPAPISGPAGDELPHRGRQRGGAAGAQEDDEPELQRALASEAVADRAGGEQQAGEHERVGGDDPLQLRVGGVRAPRDSVGMATFRLELPTKTISRLRQSTASVHHRRAWTAGSA